MQRQSDRDFPRTNFLPHQLSSGMKEGKHFRGMILTLILELRCSEGNKCYTKLLVRRQIKGCQGNRNISLEEREGFINTLELILGMEDSLSSNTTTRERNNVNKWVTNFMNQLNSNCSRRVGMGNRLIKTHLYFHLKRYMDEWGPLSGWDSAPLESNHKTQIKAPAKRTQMNRRTLIKQTAKRHIEYRVIDRIYNGLDLENFATTDSTTAVAGGEIKEDGG